MRVSSPNAATFTQSVYLLEPLWASTREELITAGHVGAFQIKQQRKRNPRWDQQKFRCPKLHNDPWFRPSSSPGCPLLQHLKGVQTATSESHSGNSSAAINVCCFYKCLPHIFQRTPLQAPSPFISICLKGKQTRPHASSSNSAGFLPAALHFTEQHRYLSQPHFLTRKDPGRGSPKHIWETDCLISVNRPTSDSSAGH